MADVQVSETEEIAKVTTEPSNEETADKKAAEETSPKKVVEKSAEDPPTKLESQIINQIEYYFSDANLARDKFLTEETKKDDGWVTFDVLLTFKRLSALSTDKAEIANAMYKSQEGLIEINDDRSKIRRNPERPLPEQNEEARKECIARTAYVKGFPLDLKIDDLIEYFHQYQKVSNVIMRKYLDKPTKTYKFKGSAFVAFASKDHCEKFLEGESKYNDQVLEKKWQSDYYEAKKEERLTDKNKKKSKNETESPEINLPKGAVFYLEGLGADTTRESIKEAVSELGGEVAFIDYNKGDKAGHVRLTTENSAAPLVEKLTDSKLKVNDIEASVRVIEGTEETEFLKKVVENMKSRRNQNNKYKSGGRNNRFQNRKRGRDGNDGPPTKRSAK